MQKGSDVSEYTLLVHRHGKTWPAPGIRRTLEVMERELPEFFPARLPVAPGLFLPVTCAADFREKDIAKEFISEFFVRVPFRGAHGEELAITDNREDIAASTVTLVWSSVDKLPPTAVLKRLLGALGTALEADWGMVSDDETFMRDDIHERRFIVDATLVPTALFWMNWIGPKQLRAMGPDRLSRLASLAEVEPRPPHGTLVILQEEPFSAANPAHVGRQAEAEAALGLAELHRQHPSD
jgi:hypothetical protein